MTDKELLQRIRAEVGKTVDLVWLQRAKACIGPDDEETWEHFLGKADQDSAISVVLSMETLACIAKWRG